MPYFGNMAAVEIRKKEGKRGAGEKGPKGSIRKYVAEHYGPVAISWIMKRPSFFITVIHRVLTPSSHKPL